MTRMRGAQAHVSFRYTLTDTYQPYGLGIGVG